MIRQSVSSSSIGMGQSWAKSSRVISGMWPRASLFVNFRHVRRCGPRHLGSPTTTRSRHDKLGCPLPTSRKSDGLDLLRRQGGPRSAVPWALSRRWASRPRSSASTRRALPSGWHPGGRWRGRRSFGVEGSRLGPPWPAFAFATGRTTIPYIRALRRRAGLATYTVILMDPRTGPKSADLIWVPEHDRRRGAKRPPHSDGTAPFFTRTDRRAPCQRSARHRGVSAPACCVPHRRSQRRL